MSNTRFNIEQNILEVLRTSGLNVDVQYGPAAQTPLPRIDLFLQSAEIRNAEDEPLSRWHRATYRLELTLRGERNTDAQAHLRSMLDSCTARLLLDPSRDGHCIDLPWGAATEIIGITPIEAAHPMHRAELRFRCHWQED